MEKLEEALLLQLSRFSSARASMVEAHLEDVKSANSTGLSYEGHQVYSDGTWFRGYNPLDQSSWFPDAWQLAGARRLGAFKSAGVNGNGYRRCIVDV